MPNIQKVQDRLANASLSRYGQDIFINSFPYTAIFVDDEFQDETGYRKELTITVKRDVAERCREDDDVYIDHDQFKIKHIPDIKDPLVTVDLKRV